MKLRIKPILLVLTLFFSQKSYSQVNISDFFQNGSVWHESLRETIGIMGGGTYNYIIQIGGDTLINNTTYKKVIFTRSRYASSSYVDNVPVHYGTIGGVRVNNREVFFIRTQELPTTESQAEAVNRLPLLSEKIFYDYNLALGDSIAWKSNPFKSVRAISTLPASNNISLFKYTFYPSMPYQDTWIEGIGSDNGFFGSYRNRDWRKDYQLICFSSPTISYPANSNCLAVTSLEEERSSEKEIKVYPNPLTGSTLHFSVPQKSQITNITVYNLSGDKVFHQNITGNLTDVKLDLPSGFYLVKLLTNQNKTFVKKVVKF